MRDPLDTDTVADLEVRVAVGREGDDLAGSFVAADEREFVASRSGGEIRAISIRMIIKEGKDVQRPVAEHDMQIGVADAGVLDLDEGLAGLEFTGLNNGDLRNESRRQYGTQKCGEGVLTNLFDGDGSTLCDETPDSIRLRSSNQAITASFHTCCLKMAAFWVLGMVAFDMMVDEMREEMMWVVGK